MIDNIIEFDLARDAFLDEGMVEHPSEHNTRNNTTPNKQLVLSFDAEECLGIPQKSQTPDEIFAPTRPRAYSLAEMQARLPLPHLRAVHFCPEQLVSSRDIRRKTGNSKAAVHCFHWDNRIQCFWTAPQKYRKYLQKFGAFCTPDYSEYTDMSPEACYWNNYRSRISGIVVESYGLFVIPTISWAGSETWSFAFYNIAPNGTLAISTMNVQDTNEGFQNFVSGLHEMIHTLHPWLIIVYGPKVQCNFEGVNHIHFHTTSYINNKKVGGN